MSWSVIFHANRKRMAGGPPHDDLGPRHIGALYPASRDWPHLSPHYRSVVASIRPPLILLVPAFWPNHPDSVLDLSPGGTFRLGNQPWCIDTSPSSNPNGDGWTIDCPWPLEDGQPVALNVSPSLNCEGSYHGFIQKGVITEDCEGRR